MVSRPRSWFRDHLKPFFDGLDLDLGTSGPGLGLSLEPYGLHLHLEPSGLGVGLDLKDVVLVSLISETETKTFSTFALF